MCYNQFGDIMLEKSEVIKRIEEMETAFEKLINMKNEGLHNLKYSEEYKKLSNYMESKLWLCDFTYDEENILPDNLKRGVLSEDGLYDLLSIIDEEELINE